MDHFAFKLRSRDGLQLLVQGWEPDGRIRAVICLLHGLGEHSGRFAHLAHFLLPSGYAVISFDLRGHGNSEGVRGHFPSIESVLQDVDELIKAARERCPQAPRFLYGHSLGGVLALNYVLNRKPQLAGVVVTSPALRTALENQKVKIAVARFLALIAPALTLPSGLDTRALSRDSDVVRDYVQDALVHDRASCTFAIVALNAIRWTYEHAGEFQPPLLVMHGTADQLAYSQGSQEFASRVNGDCTVKLWNGLYHEIHNEPEKGDVFAYLLQWLDSHLNDQYEVNEEPPHLM